MTASTVTDTNPTGITNYNISRYAQLPEWQHLAQALNTVALAANRANIPGGQDDLVNAVAHLARGIAFMDCCEQCENSVDDDAGFVDTSTAPYATTIDGDWLHGRYRCWQGHEWTCGHALNIWLSWGVAR
jgi:hypothetical protein